MNVCTAIFSRAPKDTILNWAIPLYMSRYNHNKFYYLNKLIKELYTLNKLKNIFIGLVSIFLISFIWTVIFAEIVVAEILSKFLRCFTAGKEKKFNCQKGLVSITIVNWNSEGYIIDCLRSICLQRYPHIEVIIVDNNSHDDSLEQIKEYAAKNNIDAKIIKNNKNTGFAKAQNQGIRIAKGEYILALNFDVFLSGQFIENMVSGIKQGGNTGFSSGKIFQGAGKEGAMIFDTTGVELRNLFCSDRGQGDIDKGQYDRPEYIFGASGCASFYRREMLEDIKFNDEYFDETFNTYVEDVDLSWRAQLKGWRCLYNPGALAFHQRGVTRRGDSQVKKRIYNNYFVQGFRNRYLMILKNLPLSIFIREFRFIIWGELKFWASVLLTKRYFYAKFIADFILLSPCILIKRIHVINTSRRKENGLEPLLIWEPILR